MTDQTLFAEAVSLKDLLPYSDEKLSKKAIINEHGGLVATLTFNGGELPTHTAPCNVMVYAIDGTATITIDGKDNHLKEGDFIIIPENAPHSIKPDGKFKMLLIKLNN